MKVRFTVRLPLHIATKVTHIANALDVSVNEVFNCAVVSALANGSAIEKLKDELQKASNKGEPK
jgi:hypothetical protein